MAERLIASVLKTEGGKTSVGSNPTSSSYTFLAQLVEQWSPKPKVLGSTPRECATFVHLINKVNKYKNGSTIGFESTEK